MAGQALIESSLLMHLLVQLAAAGVLHHQVVPAQRLDHLEQTNHVRMVQLIHQPDLSLQHVVRFVVQFVAF